MKITFVESRRSFSPGEQINGMASWALDATPSEAQVRLCWLTRGKGTSDMKLVSKIRVNDPTNIGEERFSFTAPDEPHSFSGKLISLVWFVELVIDPGNHSVQEELVIAPHSREIILPTASSREPDTPPASRPRITLEFE
jgi:hypothetical protein